MTNTGAKSGKDNKARARLPKGFGDASADDLRAQWRMIETIRRVYESYGFEPLETPAIEYTEALGKFLPDQDRPNAGVFSFQDEDEQWLSLRYDLTAPLARYVAEGLKEQKLSLPFRRYAFGPVWRNEKPGPGRFRQFMQFDADTVGTDNIAADAEICMLAADTLEALGLKGKYVIKVNSRKILDGVMEMAGLSGDHNAPMRLTVMRAIDKLDRLKFDGVEQLLGKGRRDESGDYTKGAELSQQQIRRILDYMKVRFFDDSLDVEQEAERRGEVGPIQYSDGRRSFPSDSMTFDAWSRVVEGSVVGQQGIEELRGIATLARTADFGPGRIIFDATVVRGLEYYTGPVFEAEITIPVKNEDGQLVRFGSVGGGGRYDGLVERFLGTKVPATGFSIGVSRLQAALAALGRSDADATDGPVVVLVMDKGELPVYQKITQTLRAAGIRAEMYLGTAGMKAQMKYADKRGAPCVVIQGGDERNQNPPMVQIKDLIEGAKAAASIKDSKEWREGRPAQVSVPEARMVEAVREVLARHEG
jgi:histidyl-tRNA synthetase